MMILILILAVFSFLASPANAQSEPVDQTMEAKVIWIIEDRTIELLGKTQPYQKLRLEILTGPDTGQQIEYENGLLPMAQIQRYRIGDQIIIAKTTADDGQAAYYIMDQVRRPALYTLAVLFVGLTLLVARKRAFQSLAALVVSFVVIFMVVLPQILAGRNPILVSIVASLLIIPVTFYVSHGWSKKTHVAVAGTLLALLITAGLASVFSQAARLTGFASEEATFLQASKGQTINIQGLLLAGIIIGVLGVLDDVTVSQSGVVHELYQTNPSISSSELFKRAMNVGTDHIASMINTLVLVYTGAAMPLLLLFLDTPHPITEIINYEIVAEEIVRMLVGSIGLVLAVPLTTFLAVFHITKK